MVGASALARSGDFLLRLAGCQRKDLVAEVRRTVFAAARRATAVILEELLVGVVDTAAVTLTPIW